MTGEPGTGAASPAGKGVLDCRGQRCPLPVIALARRVVSVPVGSVVELWADDPAAVVDVPAWCRLRAQDLLDARPGPGAATIFTVRRAT